MKVKDDHLQQPDLTGRIRDINATIAKGRRGPNIWKESYTIRSYEVDASGSLSVLSICNFMQDAAGRHADALGIAIQDLLPQNYTWVLSRLVLRMDSYPGRRDPIQVYTWPSGIQKLFALRDFRFTDQDNRLFGASVTAWLVIDANTRRPMRIQPFIDKLDPFTSDRALMDKLDKLPKLEQHDYEQRFCVRYRDLDVNQHVNNVSYIEWVIESIPPVVQKRGTLAGLEINFLSEVLFGDYIIARCQPKNEDQSVFLHSVVREENGQELIRAKTVWKLAD